MSSFILHQPDHFVTLQQHSGFIFQIAPVCGDAQAGADSNLASCHAVHTQYNAGDVAGFLGGQEHIGIGNVLGLT